MATSLIYIIFAIFALSFLIFIHELGHFWMARRVGMRVDTFSIGFGKPIYTWVKNGVKWQIGWLLCGGYVKIAGMEMEKGLNPYEVPDGFFAKSPFARIKVAFMGPLANLLFAFVVFAGLWFFGGREKSFSEFTSKIGWVDPQSELFTLGIRPGDEITSYDSHPFHGMHDLLYANMTAQERMEVAGFKVNYLTGEKIPFEYTVKTYQHPNALDKGFRTTGIMNPASYAFYNRFPNHAENPILEGSPMEKSGIQYGDRILWIDGELIFSVPQIGQILNSNRILLTVQRGSDVFLARVPKVAVNELRLDPLFREELIDWQFEAKLNQMKLQNLYVIPYNVTNDATVENTLQFVDKEDEMAAFPQNIFSLLEEPLQPGDKILAVNRQEIQHAYQLLKLVQTPQVNIIVQRNSKLLQKEDWNDADASFDQEIQGLNLQKLIASIGSKEKISSQGDLILLNPVTPKPWKELTLAPEKQVSLESELQEERKAIEAIDDPERRALALKALEKQEKQSVLGLILQDRRIAYNPSPLALFTASFQEIQRTLTSIFSGTLNPKWLAGPVGIVQIVQTSSTRGLTEVFYWLGMISLNLGVLNLLPIPMLDGGTILITLIEMVTGKRLHPKTLERLILPFAVLFIGFFLFITYHDLLRLFSKFWR